VSSDCTVNLRTSEFGLVTKLNCETGVRDRRYLHNTQVYSGVTTRGEVRRLPQGAKRQGALWADGLLALLYWISTDRRTLARSPPAEVLLLRRVVVKLRLATPLTPAAQQWDQHQWSLIPHTTALPQQHYKVQVFNRIIDYAIVQITAQFKSLRDTDQVFTCLKHSFIHSYFSEISWQPQLYNSNKKAVLPQGNRAMLQVFFSVEVRQHSLQV